MKTAVPLIAILSFFSGPVLAQSNPYMPASGGAMLDNMSPDVRQKMMQTLMNGSQVGDTSAYLPPEQSAPAAAGSTSAPVTASGTASGSPQGAPPPATVGTTSGTATPQAVLPPVVSPDVQADVSTVNADFQQLRSSQADTNGALAREKMDRDTQIKALKDAVDIELRDMQRKIDAQDALIKDLRYNSH